MSELDDFVREPNAALLDLSKLEAFCKKYRIAMPSNPESVRRAILKARTAVPALPEEVPHE